MDGRASLIFGFFFLVFIVQSTYYFPFCNYKFYFPDSHITIEFINIARLCLPYLNSDCNRDIVGRRENKLTRGVIIKIVVFSITIGGGAALVPKQSNCCHVERA